MSESKFPKVEYVTFETDLPKLGKVKFRPFTIGEHKKLLEAIEIGEHTAVLNTLVDILKSCTFNKVDIENTEMYILDKLYLEIFIKSRGEINETNYTCNAVDSEGNPCNTTVTLNIPLNTAYLEIPEKYSDTAIIKISETGGIKLRQPTVEQFKKLKSTGEFQISDEFIFASIECVYDGDKISIPGTDFTMAELADYIETLPDQVMNQLTEFFNSTPSLRIDLKVKCPKCGNSDNVTLRGLDDFFD